MSYFIVLVLLILLLILSYFPCASDILFNGLNDNVEMNKYQGKKIKVVANAELVQAKHGVFAEKWGLSENKDGDIYTKLKKISNDQGQ